MIAVPLFVVGVALNFIPFGMLWRYFGFANQALAAIMLWAAAAYLLHRGKFHWIASVPACFMTAVSAVYICFEKTMGFGMSYELSNIVGIAIALICFALLLTAGRKVQPTDDLSV
jgi:carbon starvation protein CstA